MLAPGNFVLVGAEVIEGAARPGHGEAEAHFGAGARGGILGALVKGHADVGAESYLNLHGMFRSKRVRTPVEVGAEADTVIGDFAERIEREDLEAARVGEQGARPAHEAVQAAHAANGLVAGAQIQVIGIAEDDFRAEGFEHVLRNGFDCSLGADGHEDGCFDGLMGEDETGAPATCGGCGEELEGRGHSTILAGGERGEGTGRTFCVVGDQGTEGNVNSGQGSEEGPVDAMENTADGRGEVVHACDADERDQAHQQSIFDQIPSIFAVDEAAGGDIELEKQVLHRCPSSFGFQARRGADLPYKSSVPFTRNAGSDSRRPAALPNARVQSIP